MNEYIIKFKKNEPMNKLFHQLINLLKFGC